jgi:hypothetical protein
MRATLGVMLGLVLVGAARSDSGSPGGLTRDNVERVHKMIRLKPEEAAWDELPWMTSITEARKVAAKSGKPLLIWGGGGGGHPCGTI